MILNKDGIQQAGERGVANQLVLLLDSSNRVIAATKTRSDGFYAFAGRNQNQSLSVLSYAGKGGSTTGVIQSATLVDNSGAGQFKINFGIG